MHIRWYGWVESVAITGLACGVPWLVRRASALLEAWGGGTWIEIGATLEALDLGQDGYWFALAIAPLLVALRHGLVPAVMSTALVAANAALFTGIVRASELAMAGIVCAMFAGLSRDHWNRRASKMAQALEACRNHVDRIAQAHSALVRSHGELESRLSAGSSRGVSLTKALDAIEACMLSGPDPSARGSMLLSLLAAHADVSAASLWRVFDGRMASTPFAELGSQASAACHHSELVQRALSSGEPCSSATPGGLVDDRAVVAAIPVSTRLRGTAAVLAIHEMPCDAFHRESLQRIEAICARLAPLLSSPLAKSPGSPQHVAALPARAGSGRARAHDSVPPAPPPAGAVIAPASPQNAPDPTPPFEAGV
ncbi:MAG: hypothetical protein OXU20_29635 [Myxococcales bacterium]|nr:hypothetical protein [Myxococcales bacterium]